MEVVEEADLAQRGAQIWAAFSAGFATGDETQRPKTQIKSKQLNYKNIIGETKTVTSFTLFDSQSFNHQIHICFYTF